MKQNVTRLSQDMHANGLDNGDQGFLNAFFPDLIEAPLFRPGSSHAPGGMYRLPFGYEMDHIYYYPRFRWEVPCSEKSAVTFPGVPALKPWLWWSWPLLPLALTWQRERQDIVGVQEEILLGIVGSLAVVLLGFMATNAVWYAMSQSAALQAHQRECLGGAPSNRAIALILAVGLVLCSALPILAVPSTTHPFLAWPLVVATSAALVHFLRAKFLLPSIVYWPLCGLTATLILTPLLPFRGLFDEIVWLLVCLFFMGLLCSKVVDVLLQGKYTAPVCRTGKRSMS
ncbi:unnamed protein product [Ostreobium quekettii]|uniref:Uncharacterized protein n=1 Tax=Ostreobium quekettii TaxID=121088 RepID=A0A8S1J6Z8_9CHLO|nr:unnamed protein product [Ostreobium quekettii]